MHINRNTGALPHNYIQNVGRVIQNREPFQVKTESIK
jgi:hypothetical protein